MPLIVVTGIPASGKSTRALELKQFFEGKGRTVVIVSEHEQIVKAGFDKNQFFLDSSKEKHIRGLLKSEVSKLITPTNVVILDATNYIKGYRYELYCCSKSHKSTQCTLQTNVNIEEAWKLNVNREIIGEKYTREVFDALIMRYEEPDGKNRWDSPLFQVFPHEDLQKQSIFSSLFEKAAPPPNMSTQNPPLSSTNFLYDLDQTTKNIVDSLVKAKNMGTIGVVKVSGYDGLTVDLSNITIQQLMVIRRQYITYSKMHPPDPKQIPQLFVQYLTTSLK